MAHLEPQVEMVPLNQTLVHQLHLSIWEQEAINNGPGQSENRYGEQRDRSTSLLVFQRDLK